MLVNKMTSLERRAVLSLASILALRMIALFMVVPLFALYAQNLPGSTPFLTGIAIGIYGLTQALFQIPFGSFSDRFGRKPLIVLGLSIFALGSLLAAFAHTITWLIIGRALQGSGAIGSTILAYLSDLTREDQRTKSMAIAGITIGFSFLLALILGPLLSKWLAVNQLFLVALVFVILAIAILFIYVPPAPSQLPLQAGHPYNWKSLLFAKQLWLLNSGIFLLHAIFTASFIAIPIGLQENLQLASHEQWQIYLPTLLLAAFLALFAIGIAERRKLVKPFFLGGICTLVCAMFLFWVNTNNLFLMSLGLCLFFLGFSMLEAFLPSLVSRQAPAGKKGSALGIYSFAQFSGIFVGGLLGGWIYGQFHFSGIYLFCLALSSLWLILSFFMQSPRYLITQTLTIPFKQQSDWEIMAGHLALIPGIVEIAFVAEQGIAYLKMEQHTLLHPEYIRLKQQLQSTI